MTDSFLKNNIPTNEVKRSKYRFQSEIQQMMFVFGEVSDPLPETTTLVEDIIRSQVIEIIIQASAQASRKNSRYLTAEDIIFLIRHDHAKVNRLRSFLSWKDVRKNTKDGTGDPVEEVVEDTNSVGRLYRSMIKLPWELWNQYSDAMVKSSNNQDEESDNDEELEAYKDSIQRLKEADDITKAMTREEYVHYSECRQASFTYRKNKRYREWASISSLVEMKPNDDIVDCLGFLTYEIISKLTTLALKIKTDIMEAEGKKEEENMSLVSGIKRKRKEDEKDDNKDSQDTSTSTLSPSITATDFVTVNTANNIKNNDKEGTGLFSLPLTEQTPLLPEHIYEAFRRLQQVQQPMKNFRGGLIRTKNILIL
ncbi:transcription initiation factor IID, 18kD subunit-domain-containing protein [Cunninghamella echinulata]|nr:transcription initiation factor IID, 18kD subunit-domain-containing protein [Cunninghamella echinulata]